MQHPFSAFTRVAAASLGLVAMVAVHVIAQAPARPPAGAPAAGSAGKPWTAPRTGDGHPDLEGIWSFATVTPLERPRELAGKETLTEEEAAAFEKTQIARQNKDNRSRAAGADVEGAYNDFWWDYGKKVVGTRRTSLVIDPPDGRIPPLTAEAQARAKAPKERPIRERLNIGTVAEGPEDLGLSERCVVGFSSGPPIVPSAYNNNLQIVQARGVVAIFTEMIHEARIVPTDGRPHIPGNIRQWLGDSRGRWEGETLVVETTNFNDKSSFSGSLTTRGGSTDKMTLVERFRRVAPDMLVYEFTVNDPTTWTKPWTAQVPMTRSDEQLYEYACHEGNYAMTNLLRGARLQEKAAAQKK